MKYLIKRADEHTLYMGHTVEEAVGKILRPTIDNEGHVFFSSSGSRNKERKYPASYRLKENAKDPNLLSSMRPGAYTKTEALHHWCNHYGLQLLKSWGFVVYKQLD